MDKLHEMLPEDEIFLCGLVLFCGFLAGMVVRLMVRRRERKTL